jgi:hypothetical protein
MRRKGMAQCPFVLSEDQISEEGNKRINYKDSGGTDYIFYDHEDGFGKITRVQFCQLMGRKKDVFECFNESEWHVCRSYQNKMENVNDHKSAEEEGK